MLKPFFLLVVSIFFLDKAFSQIYGYAIQKDSIYFTLNTTDCAKVSTDQGAILEINTLKIESVSLMADWNEWNRNLPKYKLKKQNDTKYTLAQALNEVGEGVRNFKFLINGQYWVEPPMKAENRSPVSSGNDTYQNWLVYLPEKKSNQNKDMHSKKMVYTINIHIKNLPDSSLISIKDGKDIVHIGIAKKGKVEWTGSADIPKIVYLSFSTNNEGIPFVLEDKKYTCTGIYKNNKIKKKKITGSPLTDTYSQYLKNVHHFVIKRENRLKLQSKALNAGDTIKAKSYFNRYLSIEKSENRYNYLYMLKNNISYFSLILFSYNWKFYSLDSAKRVFNNFKPALKQSVLGKDMALGLENGSRIQIGDEMKKFSLPDTSGKLITIQDYKGKWMVLDFWASWCGPCMANIPKIKDLRKVYTEKDLVVIGISVDKYKEPWLNAIRKEKTEWLQLCDFKAEQGLAVSQYNVVRYPTYILINPEGKIAYLPKNMDDLTSYLNTLDINKTKK